MAEYIERDALKQRIVDEQTGNHMSNHPAAYKVGYHNGLTMAVAMVINAPAADVAPVVRCQNCIHAEPLDRNCELSSSVYMHCKKWRGEEETNVWHKYKKYYKDYSLVERDWFCSSGERMDGE